MVDAELKGKITGAILEKIRDDIAHKKTTARTIKGRDVFVIYYKDDDGKEKEFGRRMGEESAQTAIEEELQSENCPEFLTEDSFRIEVVKGQEKDWNGFVVPCTTEDLASECECDKENVQSVLTGLDKKFQERGFRLWTQSLPRGRSGTSETLDSLLAKHGISAGLL